MSMRREALAYLICGMCSMAVSWACMAAVHFVFFKMDPHPGPGPNAVLGLVNWVSGMLAAYILNRYFVFKTSGPVANEFLRHVTSRIGTLGMDQVFRFFLGLAGLGVYAITFIALCVTTVLNYVLGKYLVFLQDYGKGGKDA